MLPGYDACETCEGSGSISGYPDTPWEQCPSCSGVGSVPSDATVQAVADALAEILPAPWAWGSARAALVAYA